MATINPEYKLAIEVEDTPYSVNISKPKVSEKAAQHMVIDEIIEEYTQEISYEVRNSKGKKEERRMTVIPRRGDIRFRLSSLIYVPKWIANLKAKDITYNRQILASSGTVIMNELSLCPKHCSCNM